MKISNTYHGNQIGQIRAPTSNIKRRAASAGRLLWLGGLLATMTGCALNVGMVKPTAAVQGIGSYKQPLQVYIDESIKNDFDIQTAELKTAHFKDYRKSLELAFQAGFSGAFERVEFATSLPEKGYVIHLEQASPKHLVVSRFQTSQTVSAPGFVVNGKYVPGYSYDTPSTTSEVAASITWHAKLYEDGTAVRASEGSLT